MKKDEFMNGIDCLRGRGYVYSFNEEKKIHLALEKKEVSAPEWMKTCKSMGSAPDKPAPDFLVSQAIRREKNE